MNRKQEFYPDGPINGALLKWIAIITMLIDHLAAGILLEYHFTASFDIYSLYYVMRLIGRIAFPTFAFLIVQGYQHTSDINRYLRNLLVFAFISEVPFDLVFYNHPLYTGHQNIFFTLFLGAVSLMLYEKFEEQKQIFLQVLAVLIPCVLGELLSVDYGFYGVLFIVGLGILRDKKVVQTLFGVLMGLAQSTASFALLPIWFYNGERGRQNKWFFYLFYPGHLLLIYLFRLVLF